MNWKQHPTKQQLYSHLPPILHIIQIKQSRHHICSWWHFRSNQSKNCKTPMEDMCGSQRRLCWKMNLIWSNNMRLFFQVMIQGEFINVTSSGKVWEHKIFILPIPVLYVLALKNNFRYYFKNHCFSVTLCNKSWYILQHKHQNYI